MVTLIRPLVLFDLEATGVNPQEARIVQIAAVKWIAQGLEDWRSELINPGIPVPKDAAEVHGLTDEALKEASTWKERAQDWWSWMEGCDLCAYNGKRYDFILLDAEFRRAGLAGSPPGRRIDPYLIWTLKEGRTLEAAYKRFAAVKEPEGAFHTASFDTVALDAVVSGMIDEWWPEGVTAEQLEAAGRDPSWADAQGKLKWNGGGLTLTFGKHAGKPMRDVPRDYLRWMLEQDFPEDVKGVLRRVLRGEVIAPPVGSEGTTER